MGIRLALVDDHTLFRKGMRAMVEGFGGMDVVFEAGNGVELLDRIGENPVDLVLLDLEMPEMDGMEATKQLREKHPDTPILVLSMHGEEDFIIHLMELGAHGFILKTAQPERIEEAIRSIDESGYYFTDLVSKIMLKGLVKRKKVTPTFNKKKEAISQREKEVLVLICKERTTSEIADELFLSPRTVEGHRNNLMQKIGARNLAGLVVYAIKHGHYDPE